MANEAGVAAILTTCDTCNAPAGERCGHIGGGGLGTIHNWHTARLRKAKRVGATLIGKPVAFWARRHVEGVRRAKNAAHAWVRLRIGGRWLYYPVCQRPMAVKSGPAGSAGWRKDKDAFMRPCRMCLDVLARG